MPKKKRSSRSKKIPIRVRILVGALVLAVLAGIVLVKYLQTPGGKVLLLDIGFADYWAPVQEALDDELRATIRRLGLDEDFEETTRTVTVGDRKTVRRDWKITCGASRSLIRTNMSLARAVERACGFVRSSKETSSGKVLRLDVGSRKHTTHRIEIRRRARPVKKADAPAEKKPKIALVIDDFGYSRHTVIESFLDIDLQLTLSVIPTLPYSDYCLKRIAEEGKQAILHLPMEADGFVSDVAPVTTGMTDAGIDSLVTYYLDRTPGVIGANNHQGSVATQDTRVMTAVIGVMKTRGLFFFDSLTSSKSVAYNTAKSLGVHTARNDLFIDAGTEDPEIVEERLERLFHLAITRGHAIGIGHPRPWTLDAIRRYEGRFEEMGVEMVFLSALIE
jgi:polysaccharide deacetylase 2 family uncharacterized protein YibQ